ncbi:MAG: hypothetical protein C9356_16750 [Oleiphilus sp.]|nr:MAG: hypothetical protein C9356_16750 [Oleiphilus sp.]
MTLFQARTASFLNGLSATVLSLLLFSPHSLAEMPDSLVYPGSKIEVFEERLTDEAHVILSAPKRVSNTLRLENEKWVSGFEQSWLIRLDRNEDNASVRRFYEEQIAQQGELLFSCEGRACGTSSDWANKLLDQAVLTGRDSNQYYVSGKYSHNNTPGWLSVYIVKNGRRQNYAHIQYVSDTRAGQFGPNDVIYLLLDDLDQGQRDRIRRLFDGGNHVLIGLQMRHTESLALAEWESRSDLMEQWLAEYLDKLVPDWKSKSSVLQTPPAKATPENPDADAWFVFVSIKP